MALVTVNVAGKKFVVESDNKGTAKAWGRSKLDVTVSDATADDINEFNLTGEAIIKLEKAAPKAAAAPEGDAAAE